MEDDKVEDDDAEEDDVRGREMMMLRMMMLRRRKTMMLRMMISKGRTDPRTAAHTLREPAQSKCAATCHKFFSTEKEKCRAARPETTPCARLRSRNAQQYVTRAIFDGNLQEKRRGPRTTAPILCELAQWNCTSTCPFYAKTCRKNVAAQPEHPDQAPAFTLAV